MQRDAKRKHGANEQRGSQNRLGRAEDQRGSRSAHRAGVNGLADAEYVGPADQVPVNHRQRAPGDDVRTVHERRHPNHHRGSVRRIHLARTVGHRCTGRIEHVETAEPRFEPFGELSGDDLRRLVNRRARGWDRPHQVGVGAGRYERDAREQNGERGRQRPATRRGTSHAADGRMPHMGRQAIP